MDGLVGQLRPAERRISTPTGLVSLTLEGRFVRTLVDEDGRSYAFAATWCFMPSLPFDVVGHAALKRCLGAQYIDNDASSDKGPSILLHNAGGVSLRLKRSASGLDWIAYKTEFKPAAASPKAAVYVCATLAMRHSSCRPWRWWRQFLRSAWT
ncbi:hypothetical protein AB1Y20_005095 [Prymnesium parvum]|uniref:Arylamine N-acetyltransferase n=1 Tax=Prymnesium parvum TaxID=97485 RepID=A0AB34J369_PRYPA